jgi:hypothetical protein
MNIFLIDDPPRLSCERHVILATKPNGSFRRFRFLPTLGEVVERISHFPECPGFRRGWRINDRKVFRRLFFLSVDTGELARGLEYLPKERFHIGAKDHPRRDCGGQSFGKSCIEAGA